MYVEETFKIMEESKGIQREGTFLYFTLTGQTMTSVDC